jgi:hypothetical protein
MNPELRKLGLFGPGVAKERRHLFAHHPAPYGMRLYSGTKGRFEMRGIIAIVLIALGLVVLAYSGFTLVTPGKPVNIGPVHIETTQRHFIPPIAGAIALVGGILLLVVGTKRS